MSSSHALKYNICVARSLYAAGVSLILYGVVMLAALFITPISILSLFLCALLLAIIIYSTQLAYRQTSTFILSESGRLERELNGKTYYGEIHRASFYNGLFIFLVVEVTENPLSAKMSKQFITIYCDAIDKESYRLLARLINSGRGES